MSPFPQERVQQGIHEQSVDMAVPQILKEIDEVVSFFPQDRVQQRIDEQIVDVASVQRSLFFHMSLGSWSKWPRSQAMTEASSEQCNGSSMFLCGRWVKQLVEVPKTLCARQNPAANCGIRRWWELVEDFRVFFHHRVPQRFVGQIVGTSALQERISGLIVEQIVDDEFGATEANLGEDLRAESGSLLSASCRAGCRSAQDLKPRPNLAAKQWLRVAVWTLAGGPSPRITGRR